MKFSEYRELRQMLTKHQLIMLDASGDVRAHFMLETDPNPWHVPKETRQMLIEEAHNICVMCKGRNQRGELDLHIDHKFPVSRGGKCFLSNLQVLCSWCNTSKSNHLLDPLSYERGYPIPIYDKTEREVMKMVIERIEDAHS